MTLCIWYSLTTSILSIPINSKETIMKNFLIISLAALLTACSLGPAPQGESQPATRSAD